MDQLQVQVARARRRLLIEQFLGRSVWCLLAALSIALVAIAIPRITVVKNLLANWDTLWFAGAIISGFVTAAIWTIISASSALDAAIEIDRRFELRERVASSLSLTELDRSSEAGRALVGDAARAVSRIEVDEKFRVRLDRRAWWPLVPAVILFAVAMFFPNRSAESSVDPSSPAAKKLVKANMESLREKIAEAQKKTKPGELPVATDEFKKIDEGMKELTEKQDPDRTKAMVKLNDLKAQLEDKKQQLGTKEEARKQFENLKNIGAGPAEKAAQAMKEGNWEQAKAEIEKLQKQLQEGKLDDESKKQLANQLEQMKEKLEAAADARQQAMDNLKKQIEQQKRDGNLAKAGELQQKLDKLQQQQQQMNKMQQLAQKMAEAQQALKDGNGQKAADAMAQMAQQMQQMEKDQKEIEAINAMINQLDMAKDALACDKCNGAGCEACQGKMGDQMGMNGLGANKDGPPGMGMGEGRGKGPRPIAKDDTNTRDTRVRQNVGRGGATRGGLVDGPNIKGDIAEQIKEEMATLSSEPADPVTTERLLRSRQEQAKEYFETLREGK